MAQASGNRFFAASIEDAMASMFLPFPAGDFAMQAAESLSRCSVVLEALHNRHEEAAAEAMIHLLGLDHEKLTYQHAGRPFRLTNVAGNVAEDILV